MLNYKFLHQLCHSLLLKPREQIYMTYADRNNPFTFAPSSSPFESLKLRTYTAYTRFDVHLFLVIALILMFLCGCCCCSSHHSIKIHPQFNILRFYYFFASYALFQYISNTFFSSSAKWNCHRDQIHFNISTLFAFLRSKREKNPRKR